MGPNVSAKNERAVQEMLLLKHLPVDRLCLAICPSKIILLKNCMDYPQISNPLYAYMPMFFNKENDLHLKSKLF